MWKEIIFYNFYSFRPVKSFQYKRFIQTACLEFPFWAILGHFKYLYLIDRLKTANLRGPIA